MLWLLLGLIVQTDYGNMVVYLDLFFSQTSPNTGTISQTNTLNTLRQADDRYIYSASLDFLMCLAQGRVSHRVISTVGCPLAGGASL